MKKINVILSHLPDLDEAIFDLSKMFLPKRLRSIDSVTFSCDAKDEELLRRKYPSLYVAKNVSLHKPLREKPEYGNLSQIGADVANYLTKGKNSKIGVMDTGIDYNHNELRERFGTVKGYDFVDESEAPQDYNGHGTHVAGIISGKNTGVAPECSLYSLRVLDEEGQGNEVNVIRALEWAVDNHIDICNMSFGSILSSRFEKQAIEYAVKNGVILCSAAGNSGKREYSYPASYDGVVSVAAVDSDNKHAYFSTMNDRLFISAPGVGIMSTLPSNSYGALSGTSMACPHISGLFALLNSINKTPRAAKEIAAATANVLGNPVEYGAGLARADKAVAVNTDKFSHNILHSLNAVLEEIL